MSKKLKFIQYPGYIHGISNGALWVCPEYNYFLFPSNAFNGYYFDFSPSSLIESRGFVISKQIMPSFNVDGIVFSYMSSTYFSSIDPIDGFTGGRTVFYGGGYYLYNLNGFRRADSFDVLMNSSYRGPMLYIEDGSHTSFGSVKFDTSLTLKETKEITDDTSSTPDNNLRTVVLKVQYPCWFSTSFLGEYTPMGGASGTISVGTKKTKEDGTIEFVVGDKGETVYIGSIPVWH